MRPLFSYCFKIEGQELKVMQGDGRCGFGSQKKKQDRSSRLWCCDQRVLEPGRTADRMGVGVVARKIEAEVKAKTTTTGDNKFNGRDQRGGGGGEMHERPRA